MSRCGNSPISEVESVTDEQRRRREYHAAFAGFACGLDARTRGRINGSAFPDWEGSKAFSYPVNEEAPAYRSEKADEVRAGLDELAQDNPGALKTIAQWLADRAPLWAAAGAEGETLRLCLARICEAKNARLEAHLAALGIGLALNGNANGYEIAGHFGLTPQTVHERLGETCAALGLAKPLSKANKGRYAKTQHRHHVRRVA